MFRRLTLPDHEPVFLNEGTSYVELRLKKMEALRSVVSERNQRRLEEDIRLVRAGIAGERQVIFELRCSHYPIVFIHDLNLAHEGVRAQIDFLVVTPYHTVAIETKNLIGAIEIDENGAFTRTITRYGRPVREGIYSPVAQNERHIALLRAIHLSKSGTVRRQLQRLVLDEHFRSIVVLANERCVLSAESAPTDVRSQVIRADQLISHLKDLDATASKRGVVRTFKEMEGDARRWLSYNTPSKVDLSATYEIVTPGPAAPSEQTPVQAAPAKPAYVQQAHTAASVRSWPRRRHRPDPSTPAPTCPLCGAYMVRRTARHGARKGSMFWGCSAYGTTRCKGTIDIDDRQASTAVTHRR